MSRITMELLRKRSEHNEGEIHNLEEISLHQQNIDKIELLNQACRDLKILLLQNNIISKIENLNKLKKLEYLNLALNNIEVIENLEGLESLKKLDLTANFIGDLKSVKSLRFNENLQELILMGNPCVDYDGYKTYVTAVLPQLKELDMTEINRTERIEALQRFAEAKDDVTRGFHKYFQFRQTQIDEHKRKMTSSVEIEEVNFWEQKSQNTPETRIAIAEKKMKSDNKEDEVRKEKVQKPEPKLFNAEGKPYNINRAKVPFRFIENDDNVMLEVEIYKHLDTSYIDVDIQTFYVRVTIKGKVLQLTLPCEICPEKSFAKRNTVTGNLAITMARLHPSVIIRGKSSVKHQTITDPHKNRSTLVEHSGMPITKRELLEIGPPPKDMDFSRIVEMSREKAEKRQVNFTDNPEVPPLE